LYSRLQDVLGSDHADTLMTYPPRSTAEEVATGSDIDRLEDRFDRLAATVRDQQRFYVGVTVGTMTALTAISSIVVGMLR
jgi:hypothetical protein